MHQTKGGQRDKETKGRRDEGTKGQKGQRDDGTKGRRDKRDEGMKNKRNRTANSSFLNRLFKCSYFKNKIVKVEGTSDNNPDAESS